MVIGVKFILTWRNRTLEKSTICDGNSALLRAFLIRFLVKNPVCGFVPFRFLYEF